MVLITLYTKFNNFKKIDFHPVTDFEIKHLAFAAVY